MLDKRSVPSYLAVQHLLRCSNTMHLLNINEAITMANGNFDQFNTITKTAMESAKELETINLKLLEQITRKNMELFSSAMELNNKLVSALGQSGDVQQIFNEQMKISSEYSSKVITTIKETADILTDSKDDYQTWFENGFKVTAKSFQEVAPTAPKSGRKKAA